MQHEHAGIKPLPIITHYEVFLHRLSIALERFPSSQKFAYRQRVDNKAMDVWEALIEAEFYFKGEIKRKALNKAGLELRKLQALLRLSKERGFLGYITADDMRYVKQRYMGDGYYLQMDIRKYFFNIKENILKRVLDRYFKDDRLKELMLMFCPANVGIGNLLSGVYGMLCLSPLDSYIKHELGCKKYIRFMDDFVIFDISKKQAFYLAKKIEGYVNILGFSLSKIKVNKNMCNFIGYRTTKHYRLVRKYSIKKFKIALQNSDKDVLNSYLAHAKNTMSLKYFNNLQKRREYEILQIQNKGA